MRRPVLATVCAWCGRIRGTRGDWQVEEGLPSPSPATTHAICPECLERALDHVTMESVKEAR